MTGIALAGQRALSDRAETAVHSVNRPLLTKVYETRNPSGERAKDLLTRNTP